MFKWKYEIIFLVLQSSYNHGKKICLTYLILLTVLMNTYKYVSMKVFYWTNIAKQEYAKAHYWDNDFSKTVIKFCDQLVASEHLRPHTKQENTIAGPSVSAFIFHIKPIIFNILFSTYIKIIPIGGPCVYLATKIKNDKYLAFIGM